MAVSKGECIAPTASTLRKALESAIGADLRRYITIKDKQIRELGFKPNAIEIKGKLHASGEAELVDAFLGLGDGIRATKLRTTETRFDISLPIFEAEETVVKISPSAADTCTITVRSNAFAVPASFRGQVFFPPIPGLPLNKLKVRIEGDFFSIITIPALLQYSISTNAGVVARPISKWLAFWKLGLALSTGNGTLEIESDKNAFRILIELKDEQDKAMQEQCRKMFATAEAAVLVARMAGLAEEPVVTDAQLDYVSNHLLVAAFAAGHTQDQVSLIWRDFQEDLPVGNEVQLTFVSYVPLGATTVGYFATVAAEIVESNGVLQAVSKVWKLGEMRALNRFPSDYDEFAEFAKAKTKLEKFYVVPKPED